MADLTEGAKAPAVAAPGATESVEATVQIRALSSDGSGVGNLADGRVIFVPRTAPGDEIRLRITHGKPRWARGQLRELLAPSPHRVPPACPYYEECGGWSSRVRSGGSTSRQRERACVRLAEPRSK